MARARTLSSAKVDIKRHLTYKNSARAKEEFLDKVEGYRNTLKAMPVSGRSLGNAPDASEFFALLLWGEYLWVWSYAPSPRDTESERRGWVSIVHIFHTSELKRPSDEIRTIEDVYTVRIG